MTPHPDLLNAADLLQKASLMPLADGNIESVRDYLDRVTTFASAKSIPLPDETVCSFQTPDRSVPCKLYWPDTNTKTTPHLIVYCHGGGFRHGTLAGWDAPLRHLVRNSGVAVLSIDYALAPEYPFPAAFNEVVSIVHQLAASKCIDNRPFDRLAIGGDSAGANLALGTAIALRDTGHQVLHFLLLIYGVYSKDLSSPSWQTLGGYGGHGLSVRSMEAYWKTYTPAGEDDWRVQPLHANLAKLPPAQLVVGALDPLLDENLMLEAKLKAAGGIASLTVVPGIIHGVLRFIELAPVVQRLLRDQAKHLERALG